MSEIHGFLNIDKPLGWTSHDVVGKLRRILRTRKVGHAGTLDPAATGVLVAGVGRATKFLDDAQSGRKSYVGHVVLGTLSNSADIDGRIEIATDTGSIPPSFDAVQAVVDRFVGTIEQVPPKYSAVKKDGEPLYRKMRRGEDVEVPVRTVAVFAVDILRYEHPDLILQIDCGTGVYIRSLARDIGEELGVSGYLHHLIRTRVGHFALESALSLDELDTLMFPESWTSVSHAIDTVLTGEPALALDKERERAWYHGRSMAVRSDHAIPDMTVRSYTHQGNFVGVGRSTSGTAGQIDVRPRTVIVPS
jgi:tRNA pseudouridine55 synthase